MKSHADVVKIFRTAGRIFSIILFLLWGSFFVEHLSWFVGTVSGTPPFKIWLAQISHGMLLVGYLLSLRWERTGSVLIVVTAFCFFGFAAGKNAVAFIAVSMFPVMSYSVCWVKERYRRQ